MKIINKTLKNIDLYNYTIIYGLLLFLVISCSVENVIFKINEPKDILQIVKADLNNSSKKVEIPLTYHEKVNSYYQYSAIKTVFENDNFKIMLVLSKKEKEKLYHILAKNINKQSKKVVSTFLIASYNEKTDEFCGGNITSELKVERTCKDVDFTLVKQIDDFGNLLLIRN